MITYALNDTIPRCPASFPIKWVDYPSSTIISLAMFIVGLTFSIIIAVKYNSVKVFNRKIRTQNISNTMWVLFYLALAARAACNTVRFAIDNEGVSHVFFLSGLLLHGITAFTLSLALNHQRKYRSTAPPAATTPVGDKSSHGRAEAEPLLAKSDWFRRSMSPIEVIFFFLFIVYLVFLYIELIKPSIYFWYLFVASFLLQRFPVILLVIIIMTTWSNNEGPSRGSKMLLFSAMMLNLANDLPLIVWAVYLPNHCIFGVTGYLSWVDILSLVNFVSLLMFFLFLRSEYLRNMEECIWSTVSQIQDTFDFRRF